MISLIRRLLRPHPITIFLLLLIFLIFIGFYVWLLIEGYRGQPQMDMLFLIAPLALVISYFVLNLIAPWLERNAALWTALYATSLVAVVAALVIHKCMIGYFLVAPLDTRLL